MDAISKIIDSLDRVQTHILLFIIAAVLVVLGVVRFKWFAIRIKDRIKLQKWAALFFGGGIIVLILTQIRG